MILAGVYDQRVDETAARHLKRAVDAHQRLVKARATVQACQAKRNAELLAAWRDGGGAEMSEMAAALGISTQAVSKALGRPTGRTWHVAGTGKTTEVVADGD